MTNNTDIKYFVVGASWGGEEDCSDVFLREGTWWCFSKDAKNRTEHNVGNSVENMKQRMMSIKAGDRLAMKKMHKFQESIVVRHLGIVKAVDFDAWRIYVNWLPTGELERIVEFSAICSIHGGYSISDPKIHEIFCI
ncbi:MAG: hypothetical protein NTW85_11630 [Methylococcales bacterium]|nr:hypothetical protein [Methylococcales bacterium]